MKKLLLTTLLAYAGVAFAAETITVLNPQGPGYSGTPQFMATIDEANKLQSRYQFVPEFKVGGFESVALLDVKSNPQNKITSVVTSHLEAIDRGLVNAADYTPMFANGDACWALAGNFGDERLGLANIKDVKELVVGAPALGGALHLMALELGKRYNKPVRFIFYKTNGEAVYAMMQGDVNMTLDRVSVYQGYKKKFPNVTMLAMTCNRRHQDAPELKTLHEQGVDVPPIFNVIMTSKDMDATRRQEIKAIFEQATKTIGEQELVKLGDHVPAMFQNLDSEAYYRDRTDKHIKLRKKWHDAVEASR